MDDVIFAGTAKRPALGRAEVALTIDNSAGLLPIEFTEVTVSRILFRTGESEYAINGAPCRLLDVQELLSDAGVGRQQHVIVSQGQIDGVLNARPEERRAIIEAREKRESEREAERIKGQVAEGVDRPKPSISFEVGETVRVSDGPFASFSGLVEEVDHARARLKVEPRQVAEIVDPVTVDPLVGPEARLIDFEIADHAG